MRYLLLGFLVDMKYTKYKKRLPNLSLTQKEYAIEDVCVLGWVNLHFIMISFVGLH